MALTQRNTVLNQKAAAHLLRRATFGATKEEIDNFIGLSPKTALQKLFAPTPLPKPPLAEGANLSWTTTPPVRGEDEGKYQEYFKRWWLGQILGANVPKTEKIAFSTREKMVFFLHTFLTTIQETVQSSRALYFQNVLFRKFAFDGDSTSKLSIKELTKKICVDNAMLNLLDGRLNVKNNPNENFSRELLELYTIGKGLTGKIPETSLPGDYVYYTEIDVQQAAKVLTGWDFDITFSTLDTETNIPRGKLKASSSLVPNQHDNTVKTFSSKFSNATISPNPTLLSVSGQPTEASILDEISQLINLLYTQDETAKNVCRKLYRFYVYHDVTTDIDATVIMDMVNILKANNYKIQPVVEALLCSEHFFDLADLSVTNDTFGAIIKSPLDLLSNTLRFFEYELPNFETEKELFYKKTETLLGYLNLQGLNFLNPYDVAGYEAYYQYPLYNRTWINTNALANRYNLIFKLLQVDTKKPEDITIDLVAYVESRFDDSVVLDPKAFTRKLASYLFPLSVENTEITTIRYNWFESEYTKIGNNYPNGAEQYLIFKWNLRDSSEADLMDARGMLQDLFNSLLQSPEYQLM